MIQSWTTWGYTAYWPTCQDPDFNETAWQEVLSEGRYALDNYIVNHDIGDRDGTILASSYNKGAGVLSELFESEDRSGRGAKA
jgi:hypothetical protein